MIVGAHERMLPQLKQLWADCFQDPPAYAEFYFANRFRPEEMFVWLDGGEPGAMLSILPCEIMLGGEYRPAQYVYAVATREDLRGAGVSTSLLEYANTRLERKGRPITFLVPASEDLTGFYERRGYRSAFSLKSAELGQEDFAAASLAGYTFTSATPHVYQRLRDKFFVREGYVRWGEDAVSYALRENEYQGGTAFKITSHQAQGIVLCTKMRDKLFVREIALPDELIPSACAALARRMRCSSALLRLPADSGLGGEPRGYGMINEAAQGFVDGGYLNLALD